MAVDALRGGLPVILPTDTVYGLCADAFDEAAVDRLYRLKGRGSAQPTALLCASVDALQDLLPELDDTSLRVAERLLPGPYTLIVANPQRRFRWLTGERADSLGVRVPELPPPAAAVVAELRAVAATSANAPGEPDPRTLADVPEAIRAGCGAILDVGELPGTPSTIVDLTRARPEVVREGAAPADVTLERVRAAVARPE